ncbi:keratin-like protein KRT222 isoform X2 [Heterodontus francisci]
MSPVFYRLLWEKGLLSDQQIQIIQKESSQEFKIAKLLSLLEGEGCWVLEPFADLLSETGYVQLAKVLRNTALTKRREKQDNGGKRSKLWNQMQTLEQELEKGYMEEALALKKTLGDMKREYLLRLQDLENEVAFAERERDVARREQNVALRERESLLRKNKELLKTLKHLRQSLEQQESKWYGAAQTSQALLYKAPTRRKWN